MKDKNSSTSLSVFFPAYNEQENIGELLDEALKVIPKLADDYEIIVVDDGSSDQTASVVKKYCQKNSGIKLVSHKINRGYGSAVWSGFKAASKQLIFFCDSDRQFDLREIKKLLRYIDDFDAVVGYRNPRRDPKMRLLNAWGWKMLVRSLFKVKIRDVDCAFKLFRREALGGIQVKSRGAMFSAELMIRLIGKGAKIAQVPVGHYPRRAGKPTGASPKVIKKAFVELWRNKDELKKKISQIPPEKREIMSL